MLNLQYKSTPKRITQSTTTQKFTILFAVINTIFNSLIFAITQNSMDARTERRMKRESVREEKYAEFVKENTRKKNITAREQRMLRRRILRDEYMKNEELKKKDKMRRKREGTLNKKEKEEMVSIPLSDLREILQAKRETQRATLRGMALGEINYQLWKIQRICEKYVN